MERVQIKPFIALAMILVIAIANNGVVQVCNAQSVCNVPISGLMACKPAVTPPNPSAPTSACCSALTHADMRCLCSYKNSNVLPSLGIDPNLALQLPPKCKLPRPNC
ncbi:putative lipid-transfer protein DIR1 [Ricinus communis]|uniref:Lipid binding protein, putative n=1 Tax=Ricinus communis TaxID=3988 RepID=B9SUL9_RICCO|nr:putative lipid-transfer protein DIR1 [Ricinus communis]EEF32699.1 lipid binding protein, putative [Ricinus communis]|eukprot:XP_002529688.1 putative lipid-transfer protein DIR1 [Ricinus communis]